MPGTSEGFENTGLPPNPAVSADEIDPTKFDPQMMELILRRLNRDLAMNVKSYPELIVTLQETLQSLTMKRDNAIEALRFTWEMFHKKFPGCKSYPKGTWPEALEEVAAFIRRLQARLKDAEASAIVSSESQAEPTVFDVELLKKTDRSALIESIPELATRLSAVERDVRRVKAGLWRLGEFTNEGVQKDANGQAAPAGGVSAGE